MPPHVVEITRREEFSASHRLDNPELSPEENQRLFGICNNPHGHGHNYEIEVTVRGRVSDRTGMVMNLTDLMTMVTEKVVRQVDHKHLNHDVSFLEGVIPTAENLAVAFWDQLESELAEQNDACHLYRIRLFESRSNFVEYYGPKSSPSPTSSASS